MAGTDAWRRGHALLEERARAVPALLRTVLRADPPRLPWSPRRVRRVVTTGAGSSAAHARLVAALLQDAGLAARFAPLTSFAAPPADAIADALVVFSQGLSPNARLALRDVESWSGVLLVTALPEGDAARTLDDTKDAAIAATPPSGALTERRRLLADLVARGVAVQRVPAAEEYGTLLRVAGPLLGSAAAIVIARAAAASAGRAPRGLLPDAIDLEAVCAHVADAPARLAREHPDLGAAALDGCALLASGGYADLLGNLRAKVVEGPLLPEPPAWDLLDFAHGPFQQLHGRRATLLALTRDDAPGEAELIARLESMLVAERHGLVRWHSELPGALALLEHEALMNALVLRAIAERGVDQIEFPGRGDDRPLYDVAAEPPLAGASRAAIGTGSTAPTATPLVERLTWPDVDALLASGTTTALLPLGSTEQHGPHLPFATDSVIAAAVAERVAARLGDTLVLPVLPLGCAGEHLSFAGTLSIEESTLVAIVRDVARALARHGFARLLVFTAHGGNYGALRALAASVAPDVAPLRIEPFLDFARLTARLEAAAREHGVDADAAGQHAGEVETSIVLQESPHDVRRERLARGLTGTTLAPDELFYPDLRRHAPDGTVGDPRGARATRAGAYLDAWAALLAASWSAPDAKKRK